MPRLLLGDSAERLRELPDASVDAIVTDPPAGIGFMGKEWDDFRRAENPADAGRKNVFGRTSRTGPQYGRARDGFLAMLRPILVECLRVLKPGAHGLVWALPRTSHWTATALEDAGFEVRDVVTHLFGNGFPKSRSWQGWGTSLKPATERWVLVRKSFRGERVASSHESPSASQSAPATPTRRSGSADIILVRKPLTESTVAGQVQATRTGALNIDGCRIPSLGESPSANRRRAARESGHAPIQQRILGVASAREANVLGRMARRVRAEVYMADRPGEAIGRWPANLVLSHAPECVEVGTRRIKGHRNSKTPAGKGSMFKMSGSVPGFDYADADGGETVELFACVPGCPVRALDAQSGERKPGYGGHVVTDDTGSAACIGDTGGASRFFYVAKASRSERNAGLDAFNATVIKIGGTERHRINHKTTRPNVDLPRENHHPTVKPVALMRWLCRLITPPGGIVLDPFMGSGSTGIACVAEGFDFLGIEREADYFAIAEARIAHAMGTLFAGASQKPEAPP